jgi:hypothetical protein
MILAKIRVIHILYYGKALTTYSTIDREIRNSESPRM